MCYSFRLMRPLSKVETRDSSFTLYITIINCTDEELMLLNAGRENGKLLVETRKPIVLG